MVAPLESLNSVDLAKYLGDLETLERLSPQKELYIPVYRNCEEAFGLLSQDDFETKMEMSYQRYLHFSSSDILDWTIRKCKKRLQDEEVAKQNRWTLALFKRDLDDPQMPPAAVRWINHSLGYGVYATKGIPRLTFIGEYTGLIRRRHKRKDRFNNYVFGYVVGPKDSPYVIDAREEGNFTRFLNHSDEPNLTSRWVVYRGVTHIIFFANRAIKKGEQLTYDYGEYYWRSRTSPTLL